MSRRILVTGASGFIGRHAIEPLLRSGAQVHAVSRRPPAGDTAVRWHRADLLDPESRRAVIAEARPDIVLHLAWTTEHGRFWNAAENLDWSAATLDLARAAVDAGGSRVVAAGTCFEYGGEIAGDCDDVSSPVAPSTLYAIAKDAMRRMIEAFAANAGVSFAWGRLFLLYGPHETPTRLVPSVAARLSRGEEAPISSGRAVRDFMDVRDAGAGLAALALSEVSGPVNVATGRAASVRDVAEMLGREAGRPDLIRVGALPDRTEPARLVADVRRLEQEVGFRHVRSLEDGLADAFRFWKARCSAPEPTSECSDPTDRLAGA